METNNYSSVFATLSAINCNEHTETKQQGATKLTYLSWAWAWAEVKKAFPNATFTIYENKDGWNYHTDGRTAWVKTGVTIEGVEMIEYLPVMDFRNQSIPLDKVTSFDVNKAIQRSLTKAAARHGLGLYIYAGEDLPEEPSAEASAPKTKAAAKPAAPKAETPKENSSLTQEQRDIKACKTKSEINALFAKNGWSDKELINYAKEVGANLPA